MAIRALPYALYMHTQLNPINNLDKKDKIII